MKLLHQGNHRLKVMYRRNLDFVVHLHNALELAVLTAGHSTVIYDGQRVTLSPGDLFVSFPNQVHGYENSEGSEGYVMLIPVNPYLLAYRNIMDQKAPVQPVLRKGKWEESRIRELLEMAYADQNSVADPVMQGYVLLVIGKLLPLLPLRDAPNDCTNAMQSILMFLNEHYTEPLSRQDIANAVGYTESYISHLFSQTLHTTLTDYITSLRMDDAVQLLSGTSLTISQIAVSLGFGSIRSFNRAFLKKWNMTPSEYRCLARRKTPGSSGVRSMHETKHLCGIETI